jgi:hypothetical protein
VVEAQVGLQARDSQDHRGVRARHRRSRDGRRKFPVARRHPRKAGLEHPGNLRHRIVDKDVQAQRVDGFVHDETLAQEPGDDPLVVRPERQVVCLDLGPGDSLPGAQACVELQRVAHLQADGHMQGRSQLRGGEGAGDDVRAAGLAPVGNLPDRIGQCQPASPGRIRAGRRQEDTRKQQERGDRDKFSHRRRPSSSKLPSDPKNNRAAPESKFV